MNSKCPNCKSEELCPKHRMMAQYHQIAPKVKLHFSGPSPPEIFVGRIGYPNINIGILAPPAYDTKHDELRDAEDWAKNNLGIANVIRLRGQLIYGKTMSHIKKQNKVKTVMKELALTHKKVSTEFFLKKQPIIGDISSSPVFRPMTNPAPIEKVQLEENTKVKKKVDYLVNDTDALATTAINELTSQVKIDHLQKLLSAGMLGKQTSRRMVPTRWSITAIDDTVSKQMLEKIKYYQEIQEIQVLEGNYLGNYIAILILPGTFAFEGIEVWENQESTEEMEHHTTFAQDYEGFKGRKTYASNITGGYYAMRLPVCEYLEKIKKQGEVLVFREITKEYYAPLGVGIVREATRQAAKNNPTIFETTNQAKNYIQSKMKLKHNHLDVSWLLENYGRQKRLIDWF